MININMSEEELTSILEEFTVRTIKCKSCVGGKTGQIVGGLRKPGDFSPLKQLDCNKCRGKGYIVPFKSMNISVIAAVAENGAIGKNNQLPWKISEDLKYFKKITQNKTVVMGRKTYESIGRLLPKRESVIITRKLDYAVEGAIIANSLEEFLLNRADSKEEIMIIGGGEIYKKAINYANKMYITEVKTKPEADVFFPAYNKRNWHLEERIERDGNPKYAFCTYTRIKNEHLGNIQKTS